MDSEKKDDLRFKSVGTMTADELNTLNPMRYGIYSLERKKQAGVFNYSVSVEVCAGLTFNFILDSSEYYLIQLGKKVKPGFAYYKNLSGVYRLIKAKRNNDGSTFYFVEFVFVPGIYRSTYLTHTQTRLMEMIHEDIAKKAVDRTDLTDKDILPFGETVAYVKVNRLTPGDFLFPSSRSNQQPIGETTVNTYMKSCCQKAGIRKIHFHLFRHTEASLLNDNGLDPKTIAAWLGHSSEKITEKYYIHDSIDKKEQLASYLNDRFSSLISGSKKG